MNSKVKIFLSLLFACFVSVSASAQHATLSYSNFKSISVNGSILLDGLMKADGDWDSIKNELGDPMAENCNTDAILGITECAFEYDGLDLFYSNYSGKYELVDLEITNSNFYVKYMGSTIKPGVTTIYSLMGLFPDAYSKRGPDPDGTYRMIMNIGESTGTALYFEYNSSSGMITKIALFQVIV